MRPHLLHILLRDIVRTLLRRILRHVTTGAAPHWRRAPMRLLPAPPRRLLLPAPVRIRRDGPRG